MLASWTEAAHDNYFNNGAIWVRGHAKWSQWFPYRRHPLVAIFKFHNNLAIFSAGARYAEWWCRQTSAVTCLIYKWGLLHHAFRYMYIFWEHAIYTVQEPGQYRPDVGSIELTDNSRLCSAAAIRTVVFHWGEPHDGCSCNHRQHGRGEESAAKCFRFVPLV